MVAVVEVTISSAVAAIPIDARRATYPSRGTVELFVANRTRHARRVEPCDELGGARDGLGAAVDDPVEVEDDETDTLGKVGHAADHRRAGHATVPGDETLEHRDTEAV